MKNKVFLTKEKLAKFKEELKDLKNNKRPAVIERIKDARELGDLSENAEYHGAREEQGYIEGRIEELEYMIKNASIIEEDCKKGDTVGMGCTVLCKEDNGDSQEFTIVGSAEVDLSSGKISNESPIGKALIGKKPGDSIEVDVPDGKIRYKIVKIK